MENTKGPQASSARCCRDAMAARLWNSGRRDAYPPLPPPGSPAPAQSQAMKSLLFLTRSVLLVLWAGLPLASLSAEVTVNADGKGDFPTVQAAVEAAPGRGLLPNVIRLGAGTFHEKLVVPPGKGPIHLVGAGADKTVISFDDWAGKETSPAHDGQPAKTLGTFACASVALRADDLVAEGIAFRNTHGAGSQAVAAEICGRRQIFRKCAFSGLQDTLLARSGSAYFEDCLIEGQCDFIFGGASVWFERCEIRSLGAGFVAAPSTDEKEHYGFVFSRCRFTPESAAWKTYLARPWQPYGSMIVMNCALPATIRPEGWHNWDKPDNEKTARFAEGGNSGPGADRKQRVPWSRELRPEELRSINPMLVLDWDPGSGFLPSRLAALPEADRGAWVRYLEESARRHAMDAGALGAELKEAKLEEPLIPPSGSDFKFGNKLSASWLAGAQAKAQKESILSFQTPSGGWSKHVNFSKGPRAMGMHWSSQGTPATPWHYVGTFDNHSTTEEMRFLMESWPVDKGEAVRTAFRRGLDYILTAQFPNGGWPQVYPLEGGYHDNITYNDNATTNILMLLESIGRLDPADGLIDEALLARTRQGFDRGLECVLRLQYRQDGIPAVWCAQYDPISLLPAGARLKEPASLSGGESVDVVEFLMTQNPPSPEIKAAVEGALDWFGKNALTGLVKTKRDGRTWYDRDPTATGRLWARFYDVKTNRPLFPGAQDGLIYDSFNEMQARNKAGYDFFTDNAEDLLTKKQAKWRKMLEGGGKETAKKPKPPKEKK